MQTVSFLLEHSALVCCDENANKHTIRAFSWFHYANLFEMHRKYLV